jgi:hypothetical protein
MLLQVVQVLDPTTKDDQVFQDDLSSVLINSSTNTSPIEITTETAHGLKTGHVVHIKGHLVNTAANNTPGNPSWRVTVTGSNSFTLDGSAGNGVGSNTGVVVGALVGSVDGDKYPRHRHLYAYNQARLALANAIAQEYDPIERAYAVSGTIILKNDLTFAAGVANKPTGYLDAVLLTNSTGVKINILPVSLIEVMRSFESATNPIVYEEGTVFRSLSGNTYIPDAATYILRYYGVSEFTLDDIVNGIALESFNREWVPYIIDLAQLVIRETSSVEVVALARQLVAGKERTGAS